MKNNLFHALQLRSKITASPILLRGDSMLQSEIQSFQDFLVDSDSDRAINIEFYPVPQRARMSQRNLP